MHVERRRHAGAGVRAALGAVAILGLLLAAGPGAARAAEPEAAGASGPDLSLEAVVDEANRERDAALQERERKVAEAEARLAAMRADLERLIARNEALRKEIVERAAVVNEGNADSARRLIKVYENMEPEDAARILDGVSERVALTVFAGMKGRAAAGILGLMPSDKAAHLSERLAHPR